MAGFVSAIKRKIAEHENQRSAPAASAPPPPPPPAPAAALTSQPAAQAPAAPPPLQKPERVKLSTEGVSAKFDLARKRASAAENATLQQNRDAINRRLAQMGGGPGGVGLKLDQQASNLSAERLGMANEGITAAEADALREIKQQEDLLNFQREEAFAGREFARGERLGSQDFATSERLGSQAFATGERLGSQDFSAREAALGREWQEKMSKIAQDIQKSQFGQQMDLAFKQFAHQRVVDDFNMDMATKMFEEKDMLEQLFGHFSMGSVRGFGSQLGKGLFGGGGSIFSGEGGFSL